MAEIQEFNPFDDKYVVQIADGQDRFGAQIEGIKATLSTYVEAVKARDEELRNLFRHTSEQLIDVDSRMNTIALGIAQHAVGMLRAELVKKGVLEDE